MKVLSFLLVSLSFSLSFAAGQFTFINCEYSQTPSGWMPWAMSFSTIPQEISDGQTKFVAGSWTSEKPMGMNNAICINQTGTSDKNTLVITKHLFTATAFDSIDGNDACSVTGQDVQLTSKVSEVVVRGFFTITESEWLPPDMPRYQMRTYIPTTSEMNKLVNGDAADQMDMVRTKCESIAP